MNTLKHSNPPNKNFVKAIFDIMSIYMFNISSTKDNYIL